MSEPTREERIENGVRRWNDFWLQLAKGQPAPQDYRTALSHALEAAGLDSLLAERDRLREEAKKTDVRLLDAVSGVAQLNMLGRCHEDRTALKQELRALREGAQALIHEGCREELGAEANYRKCWKAAEFVLWGKLIPPEGLGPRCYDHAARHVGHHALYPNSDYALMDLRPVRAVLGEPVPEEGP